MIVSVIGDGWVELFVEGSLRSYIGSGMLPTA